MSLTFKAFAESFPLAREFRISRGAKTQADVITVIVSDGQYYGWGESVPYARYNESIESVLAQLEDVKTRFATVNDTQDLLTLLPAGSARNALDAALWDLKAKLTGKSVASLANLRVTQRCNTAQTLSIDTPEGMQAQAEAIKNAPLIKIKLDEHLVLERLAAIHQASPQSRLIVDANEGWQVSMLKEWLPEMARLGVTLIEQPVPAQADAELAGLNSPVLLCADESCHTSSDIERLASYYQAVNIKLDKTGGLTEAIRTQQIAREHGMQIMIGCMVGSSLAMAPAYEICADVQFVDLDGPLLVAQDRQDGFCFDNGRMSQPEPFLWGLPGQYGQHGLAALWHKLPD
ncbi:N-acetyl-D-Glu racemase DgcA [Alteromonas lipolytica]|uniref:Dipeptide epimerase n=1 Tax=Alteromonas lipolytica TaxID=1856405 RepID=A0A1E8FH64_9ALTE|nr:N-acetyl-D-Glu racemase DgcA [Alteromonas lipolytica]OFI34938.1 dipeptide epimerase [Alteromonas lipolytica]GGF55246.1 dipeptide epimerase [Alteromonas lipolytica]